MATNIITTSSTPSETTVIGIKTVTLTDAQIKALPTTAIELVPAPGAGKVIYSLLGIWNKVGDATYGNISADAEISIVYDGNGDALLGAKQSNSEIGNILGAAANISFFSPKVTTDGASIFPVAGQTTANVVNKSLKLFAYNTDGDFSGGDAANTLKVTVYYIIVDL